MAVLSILILSALSVTPINLLAVKFALESLNATDVATAPCSPTNPFNDKEFVALPVTFPITLPYKTASSVGLPNVPKNVLLSASYATELSFANKFPLWKPTKLPVVFPITLLNTV